MADIVLSEDHRVAFGAWVIRTRVPLKSLFDCLEGGESLDQFLEDFPSVKREVAVAILERMSRRGLGHANH